MFALAKPKCLVCRSFEGTPWGSFEGGKHWFSPIPFLLTHRLLLPSWQHHHRLPWQMARAHNLTCCRCWLSFYGKAHNWQRKFWNPMISQLQCPSLILALPTAMPGFLHLLAFRSSDETWDRIWDAWDIIILMASHQCWYCNMWCMVYYGNMPLVYHGWKSKKTQLHS